MAVTTMELIELVRNAETGDVDFMREGVRILAQALMDAEVTAQVGAVTANAPPGTRTAQRNGYRERRWDTRVGAGIWRSPGCARCPRAVVRLGLKCEEQAVAAVDHDCASVSMASR